MSTWPSVLSTISDPLATNKLNAPSHSSIETAQNDAIEKLETFIGTQASAVGTLIYNIRATASDGGGHIQVASTGGTGQVSYTKGDILVAQSASVLSKLSVGGNGSALVADSNQSSGVKWAGVAPAVGQSSKDMTGVDASVQTIAHGLPYTPTKAEFNYYWTTQSFGTGVFQSGAQRSTFVDPSSVASANTTYTLYITDGSKEQKGVVALDATNITITWTKASTPTGTAYFTYKAF